MSCPKYQGLRLERHNAVVYLLQSLLERLVGKNKVRGPEVFLQEGTDHRMDLTVTIGAVEFFVDVSIVDPCCQTYVQHHHSNTVSNAAALAMANVKRRKYLPILESIGVNEPELLIPFVLESSGRLGPNAEAFLQKLEKVPSYNGSDPMSLVHFFRRRCLITTLSYGGALVEKGWQNEIQVHIIIIIMVSSPV